MVSPAKRTAGLALIQVDGLSRKHLDQAFGRGLMPNFKERVDSGVLQLDHYRCGLPSQTTVSIAGMLYGEMLPGNQWFDKSSQKVVDTFNMSDAHQIAEELAIKTDGLASGGGSVYLSPLDGEADPKDSLFVFSDLGKVQKTHGKWGMLKNAVSEFGVLAKHLALHPAKAIQSAVHFGAELVQDLKNKKETGRSFKTIIGDAFKETILPDGAALKIADEIKNGDTPFVYIDFANFDAKTHAYGPGNAAFSTLPSIDKNLDLILDAVESAPKPYDVAIVADHGSAKAYHFHEIYGQSLQQLAANLCGREDVLSLDFGSGAHLYLKSESGQLPRKDLAPELLQGLKTHPGIAFTVTRVENDTLIEGPHGQIQVDNDGIKIKGENPVASFQEDTEQVALEIHNLAHREHAGDVLVFGNRYQDGLIDFSTSRFKGLHGGIGLQQTEPFVAWSKGVGLKPREARSAAELHVQFHEKLRSYANLPVNPDLGRGAPHPLQISPPGETFSQ